MIIESREFYSNNDLQAAIKKQKFRRATLYKGLKKSNFNQVVSSIKTTKEMTVIIIEN